tara:strand:- start:106 stop:747 length:642 start_codon:yes stop_codon:yes gene_type:complete
MSEEEKSKKEPDKNKLVLKLGDDDSALVVRTNGEIELISRDLEGKQDNYLGDLEDLNKTFTLVLAFAAALENEQLYHNIFQNLNHVLHRQWNKLPQEEKERIKDIRLNHLLHPDENDKKNVDKRIADKQEWLARWRDEIERGRAQLEEYMHQHPDERDGGPFGPEMMEGPRRKRKKKRNPLAKLKDVEWNAYDESLKTHKGQWRLDTPPDEED